MAPPQLVSLENYSDVQFRDVVHRRSMQVASSTGANVVQQLSYHHDGTSAKLSAAGLTTTDADGNVQYALIVGSNTRTLDANTFTAMNAASWSANSVFTANATHMTVQVPTLTANALSVQTLSLGNDVKFANVTANNMIVTGNINIDTSTLVVDPDLNRVGVSTSSPGHALDVGGNVNVSTGNVYRIGGTQVLSSTALGSGVVSSSLTSVGILNSLVVGGSTTVQGNLTVSGTRGIFNAIDALGNVSAANFSTNAISGTAITGSSLSLSGHASTTSLNVTTGNITAYGTNHVIDSTATISVNRTISNTSLGSGIYVGNLTHLAACSLLEVSVRMRVDANNSVSKAYVIPIRPDWYWTGWKRAVPISSTHGSTFTSGVDISLDLFWDTTQISLAIARSKTSPQIASAVVDISMKVTFQKSSGWNPAQHFVPSTGSYTGWVSDNITGVGVSPPIANLLPTTAIVQTGDMCVGIGKYRPNAAYLLDVGGVANFDSAVYCRGGIEIEGGLNYSGNLLVDGVQVTGMGLMFGEYWRLWFNPTTQNLEIHQNNNGNPTWNDFTVTGILAAK